MCFANPSVPVIQRDAGGFPGVFDPYLFIRYSLSEEDPEIEQRKKTFESVRKSPAKIKPTAATN